MFWLKEKKKKKQSMVLGKCSWKGDLLTKGIPGEVCRRGEIFVTWNLLALLHLSCRLHISIQLY